MSRKGKLLVGLTVALVLGATGYFGYWFTEREARISPAHPRALAALESSADVTVTSGDWVVFAPAGEWPTTGFIFYPGGEVDERGYAEPLHEIAARGYLVVLVPMPLQLAVFAPDKAEDVMAAFPQIEQWVIGGHSLGGAMAARFVYQHPDATAGLLLWDAYPPEGDDISDRDYPVELIHRSDAVGASPANYAQHMTLLPSTMTYSPVPGGNHMNFGRFMPVERFSRDAASATLPVDEQHRLIVHYSTAFLERVATNR